jgi:GDPmannose 4,6-dehydratase
MWLMLQQPNPDDYVIATGEQHCVWEFAEIAFSQLGLNYREYLTIDPQLIRPAEVETLLGNATKAKQELGWSHEVSFEELVREMVETDLKVLAASPVNAMARNPSAPTGAGLRAVA